MLDLRSTYVNGQWEAFLTYRIEQENPRLYPDEEALASTEWPPCNIVSDRLRPSECLAQAPAIQGVRVSIEDCYNTSSPDRMTQEGRVFTDFYVSPMGCSASTRFREKRSCLHRPNGPTITRQDREGGMCGDGHQFAPLSCLSAQNSRWPIIFGGS